MPVAHFVADNDLRDCWKIVERLDLNKKSNLMAMLAKDITDSALRTNARSDVEVVLELAGSWKDSRTADEIVADIYSSRTSSRICQRTSASEAYKQIHRRF